MSASTISSPLAPIFTLTNDPVEFMLCAALSAIRSVKASLNDLPRLLGIEIGANPFRRAAQHLLDMGLIERTPDPEDRRRGVWSVGAKIIEAFNAEGGHEEVRSYTPPSAERLAIRRELTAIQEREAAECQPLQIFERLRPDEELSDRQRQVFVELVKLHGEDVVLEYVIEAKSTKITYPYAYIRQCLRQHKATEESRAKRNCQQRQRLVKQAIFAEREAHEASQRATVEVYAPMTRTPRGLSALQDHFEGLLPNMPLVVDEPSAKAEAVEVIEDPAEVAEERVEAAEGPAEAVEEHVEAVEEHVEAVEEHVEAVEVAEDPIKAVEKRAEVVENRVEVSDPTKASNLARMEALRRELGSLTSRIKPR